MEAKTPFSFEISDTDGCAGNVLELINRLIRLGTDRALSDKGGELHMTVTPTTVVFEYTPTQ